jgi:hypothetical protein
MPVPKPNKDETQKDYIGRCMSDKVMMEDFSKNDQRYAVCINTWEKSKEEKNSEALEIDITK